MTIIASKSKILTVSRTPIPPYRYLGIAYNGFSEGTNLWPSNPFQTSSERNDLFGSGYRGLATWKWTEAGTNTSGLNNATVNALWNNNKSFTIEVMCYHTIPPYYGVGFGTAGYSSGGIYHRQFNPYCVLMGKSYGNLRFIVNKQDVWSDSVRRNDYNRYFHLALTYDNTTSTYCIFDGGKKVCEVVNTASHTAAIFGNYLSTECTQLAVYDYVAYTKDFDVSFTVPHIRNPLYGLKTE